MQTALLDEPMAKAKKPTHETTLRADNETADAVRRAAGLKNVSVGVYLRQVLLPIAQRDLLNEAKKIVAEDAKPKR